ncbi:YjeF-related protein N-terminus-domain-containing protein [Microdochium trichocladiopsis]|uniref:Enhancer of mRNA-decapping protein 3 n=1 Tax=Microdochium trichocladiopsis TaxID=1682393 RepID=A0A9P8YJ64_9PEZI|nr:YjeF-related protein N-terminus-domain-containing protein [Microdochium trichocladiopsis]KAH7041240.1 YjeF-related protein N-terminus-domain-containing protein [Microdochium trichocladiopsis]
MAASYIAPWTGKQVIVELAAPPHERIQGTIADLVPQSHLGLENAYYLSSGQMLLHLTIASSNIRDLQIISSAATEAPHSRQNSAYTIPSYASPATLQQPSAPLPFHDPAIISMNERPEKIVAQDENIQPAAYGNTARQRNSVVIMNPADRMTFSSPDQTDTTTTPGPVAELQAPVNEPGRLDTTDDDEVLGTPTAETPQAAALKGKSNRSRNRKKGRNGQQEVNGAQDSRTKATTQGKGWRQTPILESTNSFQPFASLRKSQNRRGLAGPNGENGWASEDVTDVQEAGDFDFEGGLAKFDKRTIFNEMQKQDEVDESLRLVGHNRLPRPKPGTAGGKNLHYSENVLDLPSGSGQRMKETPDDFWKSEADDGILRHDGERLSGREGGSGRTSRLRGDSRMSTSRRSQSRKASGTATIGGAGSLPIRVNSSLATHSAGQGLYAVPSNRKVETVTHLQMLVVENVAQNDFELTDELMAENAGRSIAEVAMKALQDPAMKLRKDSVSNSQVPTIAVLAGNNKSGIRAVAAGRHLRNRGINVLITVVGIEREKDLLDDLRKQIRLFRNFGGSVTTSAGLYEQLTKPTDSLSSSPQASVTLIIDALLGLTISFEELRKSEQATTYELMQWANRNEAFVMAVDIPSGIEPSSGKVNVIDGAKLYVHPRYVVALGVPKQGLLRAIEMGDESGDVFMVDEWKLYLADIGLGALVWRKAGTKIRKGVDFDGNGVLELRYQPPVLA